MKGPSSSPIIREIIQVQIYARSPRSHCQSGQQIERKAIVLWRNGGIEVGQQQINNCNRQLNVQAPLHPCQAQRECAQPLPVNGGQVPHQAASLGGRVRQRGGQGAPQARAVPGHQIPLNCRQGQAGNNKVSKERQRPLPMPQQGLQHLGNGTKAASCVGVLSVNSLLPAVQRKSAARASLPLQESTSPPTCP